MDKILVSACFVGENVRYDGDNNQLMSTTFNEWREQGRLVTICPEVAGGLAVPRPPAEIDRRSNNIITIEGENVTNAFGRGAQQALMLCQKYDIKYALLKESSPSCGSSTIYDGSFSQRKIAGEGVTTALLRDAGVNVFSENDIIDLVRLLEQTT